MAHCKRTNSSSACPRPAKSPRMGLKRTDSMLFLPTPDAGSLPCYSTLAYYKDQRQRRKQFNTEQLTIRIHTPRRPTPSPTRPPVPKSAPAPPPLSPRGRPRTPTPTAPSQVILPSPSSPVTTVLTPRTSSPLSPKRVPLPGRPVFPRTKKPEPDLYRMAIRMRMLLSPEGQKILSLGPRLATQSDVEIQMDVHVEKERVKEEADRTRRDIMSVTRDLEKMVEDICDEDVLMDCTTPIPTTTTTTTPATSPPQPTPAPPILTTSWVLVKGEDWEMVDCTA